MLSYPLPDTLCKAGFNTNFFFEHNEDFTAAKGLGYIYEYSTDNNGGGNTRLVAFRKNGVTYGTFRTNLGMSSAASPQLFTTYPNPVHEVCKLSFEKEGNYTIFIYNLLGEKCTQIETAHLAECDIDISDFPMGLYEIWVYDNDGKSQAQKFLKQ